MISHFLFSAAFLHALTNLEKQYTPSGSKLMAGEEEMRAGRPKAQDLVTAVFEYGKVHSAVSDIDELSEDPLKNCFVCAETIRAELSNGEIIIQSLDVFFSSSFLSALRGAALHVKTLCGQFIIISV